MASKVCYYILRHIDSKLGWSGLSLFRATPLVSRFKMVSGHGCVWKSVDFTTIFHGVVWNILIQKMLMTKWIWGILFSVKNLWIMMFLPCSFDSHFGYPIDTSSQWNYWIGDGYINHLGVPEHALSPSFLLEYGPLSDACYIFSCSKRFSSSRFSIWQPWTI